MCLKNVHKKNCTKLLFSLFFLSFALIAFNTQAHAGWDSCATDWTNFTGADGFVADYTYKGQTIRDYEESDGNDPSHDTNPTPSEVDLSSGGTTTNPGPYATPAFGYYDGGTVFDPGNPATMTDDYIFFRERIAGDPSAGGTANGFKSYHWNVLLDVDADGYKEYWVDLEGNYSNGTDRLNILYDNTSNQIIADPDVARVAYFAANYTPVSVPPSCIPGYSHTRVVPTNDGTGDYWIEVQVPMTAFKDLTGNQVLYPNSPVAFVYTTGASNQDPLQKDWMMNLNYLTDADPITFGDIVHPDGTPIIEFTDSAMNFVSFYTIGDRVYVYVKDPRANHTFCSVTTTTSCNTNADCPQDETCSFNKEETMTVTITDPVTGDDEVITLTETGPTTGIFTNTGEVSAQATTRLWTGTNTDNDGFLETVSGNKIYVSYTNSSHITSTDEADIVAPCEPFIQFTRANGLASDSFVLTNDIATSDKLYVTVTHHEANTNPATQQTITVALSGNNDAYTMTLTETGNNTGVFRNTTGLNTQIEVLPVSTTDSLWEDVDGGTVTATYTYPAYPVYGCPAGSKTTAASVFVTAAGGRVYFTDATGLQDVELYGPNQQVYLKVVDATNCGTGTPRTLTVRVSSPSSDYEDVTLTETAAGSGVFRNTADALVTATYSGSYTSNDGTIHILNGETVTVTYTDCNDGDSDSSNNGKTDTATYNAPSIVINEVFFYPRIESEVEVVCPMEYIQLYNATPQAKNVTGYTITDGDSFTYTIPQLNNSDISLQKDERIYIALYETAPADRYDSAAGIYYLFKQIDPANKYCSNNQNIACSSDAVCAASSAGYCIIAPSIEFADPLDNDPSDQILLYDNSNVLIDYIGWSSTISPDIDFLGDDSDAVSAEIWQDDAYVNVNGIASGQALMRTTAGYDTNIPNDWGYAAADPSCNLIITRVVVSSFSAHTENGKVVVEWETASETGTVGFYLHRKDEATGDYIQVNQRLIPGILTSRRGGEYRFLDESAVPGAAYTYLLTEIESSGKRHTYGPYNVNTDEQKTASADPVFMKAGYSRKAFDISPSKQNRLTAAIQKQAFDPGQSFGRTNPPSPLNPAPPLVTSGTKIRVTTSENSLYFLDSATLFSFLGTDISKMSGSSQLKITNKGQEVPYMVADDKSGIYFYGEELNNIYSDKNIYWLEKRTGKFMTVINGTGPVPAEGNGSFFDTIHREEDVWGATGLFTDPASDYWLWDFVFADDPVFGTVGFPIEVKDAAPSVHDATLTINLFGVTTTDHHVSVSINGTPVGGSMWYGSKAHTFTASFDQSYLAEGENTISVSGILDTGVPYSVFLVDSFDLSYQRFYKASGNKLVLRGDSNPVVTVSGFTGPEIKVFEITNPVAPKFIKAATIDSTDNGAYRISFVPSSPNAEYLAIHPDGMSSPVSLVTDSSFRLTTPLNSVDYLVITPKELKEGAQSLADYRKSRGLKPMVVELEDIMDDFNFGIYSPEAIKRFLASAFPSSSYGKKPRYVVLIGHGTEDYKNLLGLGENLLPPIMIGTIDGIAPSDNYYADTNGDHLPEMAIGRLPVMTPQELQILIEKIKAYESSSGIWTKDVLLLADYPEPGGDFPADSDTVASLLPQTYLQKKIYLSNYPIGDARQMAIDGINQGALLVNYIGHAGLDRLSQDGLIVSDDVSVMNNGAKLPVLTAMTCMIGLFSFPGYDTLGEEMLLKENGGVIAVFAPTSMSINSEASVLDRELFNAFFLNKQKRPLGDIIMDAFKRAKMHGVSGSLLEQYSILGDPALLVK